MTPTKKTDARVDGATEISICRDEDCPECGWPETYAAGTFATGPTVVGCRKCGWSTPVEPS